MFTFLLQAVLISLSGVMAPGPMTAAAIESGTRRWHAGIFLALGHAIFEIPLIIILVLGLGKFIERPNVQIGIGLAGGAFLILLGLQMLHGLRKPLDLAAPSSKRHPLWTGVLLSAGNPYFLLWWATVGLNLAIQAGDLGIMGFALFALIHWLCDLIWLEVLTAASFTGSKLLGQRTQRIILTVCGLAMLIFGLKFIIEALLRIF